MRCNKCYNEAITNTAGGKEFYYCRTCKLEVPVLRHALYDTDGIESLGEMTDEERAEAEAWFAELTAQDDIDEYADDDGYN